MKKFILNILKIILGVLKNNEIFKDLFNEFKSKTVENIQNVKANEIQKLFDKIKKLEKKQKVLIFGNGAGQSIADHFSVDITKNAKIKF